MDFNRLLRSTLVSCSTWPLFLAAASCSVIVDDFPAQCETTQDCVALAAKQPLGSDGKPSVSAAGLVCNPQHKVCEKTGCGTNAECVAALDGRPALCRKSDRTCQLLVPPSPDPGGADICRVLADDDGDDIKNDNTIWIGASVVDMPALWQGLELARRDFNDLAQGLPPASATASARRPLGFVVCEADPWLEAGAKHLVETLELPVIITSVDTTSEIAMLEKYSKPNQVFQLSTSAGGPLFKSVPNDGLIVDLVLIEEAPTRGVSELVDGYYTPLLRGNGGALLAGETPRIAVVHSSTPTAANFSRKMETELEEVSPGNVRVFGYGSDDEPSGNPAAYAGVVSDVLAFKPHVIIIMGGDEIGPAKDELGVVVSNGIDVPIEQRWEAEVSGQARPQWLGIFGAVGQLPKDMGSLDLASQLDWASRTLFIQQYYDFQSRLFTDYFQQLQALVADDPNDVLKVEKSTPYNEFMREGAYLTAYAITLLAAQGKDVTGPNLAAAARNFGKHDSTGKPSSSKFTIGQDDIFDALQSLESTKAPFFLETFQGWVGFDENGFAEYEFAHQVACLTAEQDDMGMVTGLGVLKPTGAFLEVSGAAVGAVSLSGCAKP